MPAALDLRPGGRAARWVAPVGLCAGVVCLLAGAALHSGVAPDTPPATGVKRGGGSEPSGARVDDTPTPEEAERASVARLGGGAAPGTRSQTSAGTWLVTVQGLAPAAVAVLGTMLMSVGVVFALLDWVGVLAAVTVPRPVGAPGPHRDLPAPEPRSGGAAHARNATPETPAPLPDHGAGSMGLGSAASSPAATGTGGNGNQHRPTGGGEAAPSRGALPDDLSGARSAHAPLTVTAGAEPMRSAEPAESRAPVAGSGGAMRPHPGVRSPELRAPVHETVEAPLAVDEPPQEPPRPGDLIDAWDDYRRTATGTSAPAASRRCWMRGGSPRTSATATESAPAARSWSWRPPARQASTCCPVSTSRHERSPGGSTTTAAEP